MKENDHVQGTTRQQGSEEAEESAAGAAACRPRAAGDATGSGDGAAAVHEEVAPQRAGAVAAPERELTRPLLGLLSLGALIVASFWTLRPFLAPGIWAAMIVVATWPAMLWLQARLWQRRAWAVVAMTVLLLLVFIVPLALAIGTIVTNAEEIGAGLKAIAAFRMPAAPDWLAGLPVIGAPLAQAWQQAVAAGMDGLLARSMPYAGSVTRWIVAEAGNLGFLFLQFLLTLILAALMYAHGETAAATIQRFGHRLAGERGENAVLLAAQAIRSVALGVVLTAVAQSGLGALGLAVAGVPYTGLLAAVMLLLCIAQIGPSPVLVPAVIWLYWSGESAWGTALLAWSVAVVTMDNVLRPMLIRRGADLPLLLIFAGVIGGLLGFGLVGIFVGPVVLAVAYTLLKAWLEERTAAA